MAEMTVRNFVIDSLHKFFVKIMQNINDASPWKSGTGSSSAHLDGSLASGNYSVAEGYGTSALTYAHAEGYTTTASGSASHAEGSAAQAIGIFSHAEGNNTTASGSTSHAEGFNTTASGNNSHAEGSNAIASGNTSHAEGNWTQAIGDASHAEGYDTSATTQYAHAEGNVTLARGEASHAEGCETQAIGDYSHAEGYGTTASGYTSHAEGSGTIANGNYSHAEGNVTLASGNHSHAEGYETSALTAYTHCEGYGTIAKNPYEHTQGKHNLSHSGSTTATKTIHSIGYGTAANARKNLVEVMQNGDVYIQGIGGFTGANTGSTRTLQYTLSAKTENFKIDLYESGWSSLSSIQSALNTGKRVYVVGNVESDPPYFPLSVSRTDSIASFGGYDPTYGAMVGAYKAESYGEGDEPLEYEADSFRDNIFLHLNNLYNEDFSADEIYIVLDGTYYYISTAATINAATINIDYEPLSFNVLKQMAVLRFKTGSSPNITFNDRSLYASSIKYYDGAGSFQANTDYELNFFFSGNELIISQAVLS